MSTNSFLVLAGSAQGDPTKSGTHVSLQSECSLLNKNHSNVDTTSIYLKLLCTFKFAGSIPQALLFNSSDLEKWTYISTVWIGNSTIGPRAEYVMIRKVAI